MQVKLTGSAWLIGTTKQRKSLLKFTETNSNNKYTQLLTCVGLEGFDDSHEKIFNSQMLDIDWPLGTIRSMSIGAPVEGFDPSSQGRGNLHMQQQKSSYTVKQCQYILRLLVVFFFFFVLYNTNQSTMNKQGAAILRARPWNKVFQGRSTLQNEW